MKLGLGIGLSYMQANPLAWVPAGADWAMDFVGNRAVFDGTLYSTIDAAATAGKVSFSRASEKQYQNSTDIISTVASGALARGDLGALIEPAATNRLLRSKPTAATWTVVSATVANIVATSMGFFNGITISSTGNDWNRAFTTATIASGTAYYATVYVKAGTSGRVRVLFRDSGTANETKITGAFGALSVSTTAAGTLTGITQTLQADGVTIRIYCVYMPNFTGSVQVCVGPDSNTSGQGVTLLGAQIETGGYTSFITTGASATTRNADALTLIPGGTTDDVLVQFASGNTQTLLAQDVSGGFAVPTNLDEDYVVMISGVAA